MTHRIDYCSSPPLRCVCVYVCECVCVLRSHPIFRSQTADTCDPSCHSVMSAASPQGLCEDWCWKLNLDSFVYQNLETKVTWLPIIRLVWLSKIFTCYKSNLIKWKDIDLKTLLIQAANEWSSLIWFHLSCLSIKDIEHNLKRSRQVFVFLHSCLCGEINIGAYKNLVLFY